MWAEKRKGRWEKLKEKQNRKRDDVEEKKGSGGTREERPALYDKWHRRWQNDAKTDENDSTPKTAEQGTRRSKNQRQMKQLQTATDRTMLSCGEKATTDEANADKEYAKQPRDVHR